MYQAAMDLGPRSHFQLLHGQHKHKVALATIDGAQHWQEQCYSHQTAEALIFEFAGSGDDCYLSQNAFRAWRREDNVAVLPSCFVDLDTYNKPELAGIDREALVGKVRESHPWLPPPTLAASSGRGHYLHWIFEKPLGRNRYDDWRAVEVSMVKLLAPLGADQQAKDASRVLRIADSINTKSGEPVRYHQIADRVAFHELQRALQENGAIHDPGRRRGNKLYRKQITPDAPKRRRATVTRLWTGYHVAHAQREDIRTLAAMRGPLDDYRHRFLYAFAVPSAWYCSSPTTLVETLDAFSAAHFVDPERYQGLKRCRSILDRMADAKRGFTRIWRGEEVDPRYRFRNDTLIRLLDISQEEQRRLAYILGREEKERRRTERRRERGVRERTAYLTEQQKIAQGKRQLVLDLVEQGHSKAKIAEQLGMTRDGVYKLLKRGGV